MLRKAVICITMPPSTIPELVAPHLVIEDGTSKGGNKGFSCVHCDRFYRGSLTRQLAHLLGTKGRALLLVPPYL